MDVPSSLNIRCAPLFLKKDTPWTSLSSGRINVLKQKSRNCVNQEEEGEGDRGGWGDKTGAQMEKILCRFHMVRRQ